MVTEKLRARGDRELADLLLADHEIQSLIERQQRDEVADARRHLLAVAVRLTASMVPTAVAVVDRCRAALEIQQPVELYVVPHSQFNAFSYGSERGRVLVAVTSQLLEGFDDDELAFVIGHELGHFLFEHHSIPVGALIDKDVELRAEQAIRLFSWQRFAEISADRAGLVCAGEIAPTGRAFFKIASGLHGARITFDIEAYLEQIGDIEAEAAQSQSAKDRARPDWFASHPFSPLRIRAAQLCAASELCVAGGCTVDQLEADVQELMAIMDPSYLHDRSEAGEAMRRLLFAGGVLVAAATGGIDEAEKAALERFLGEGMLPPRLNPEALEEDLAHRIEFVKDKVPVLRRAQVIRDLCVIALADGHADEAELAVIRTIAVEVEVDPRIIDRTVLAAHAGLDWVRSG